MNINLTEMSFKLRREMKLLPIVQKVMSFRSFIIDRYLKVKECRGRSSAPDVTVKVKENYKKVTI